MWWIQTNSQIIYLPLLFFTNCFRVMTHIVDAFEYFPLGFAWSKASGLRSPHGLIHQTGLCGVHCSLVFASAVGVFTLICFTFSLWTSCCCRCGQRETSRASLNRSYSNTSGVEGQAVQTWVYLSGLLPLSLLWFLPVGENNLGTFYRWRQTSFCGPRAETIKYFQLFFSHLFLSDGKMSGYVLNKKHNPQLFYKLERERVWNSSGGS